VRLGGREHVMGPGGICEGPLCFGWAKWLLKRQCPTMWAGSVLDVLVSAQIFDISHTKMMHLKVLLQRRTFAGRQRVEQMSEGI